MMNPQTNELRAADVNKARARLREMGLYPTEAGERAARRAKKSIRKDLINTLDELNAPDLFAVYVVALCLAGH